MRTSRRRGTLLTRLERLECQAAAQAAAFRKVIIRVGHLRQLPPDYQGERHVVITKRLPGEFGQERVEFEEVPGPDPTPVPEFQHGVPECVNIMLVSAPPRSMGSEHARDEPEEAPGLQERP